VAVLDTTFEEETVTDLFGEQAVLTGGAVELAARAFETLVDAGYRPEVAYIECLYELGWIADIIQEGGLTRFAESVSGTALYGGLTRGKRLVTDETRRTLDEMLAEIRSGAFAEEWRAEHAAGRPELERLVAELKKRAARGARPPDDWSVGVPDGIE
jgi:ketol-acid reductoisomerase